MAVALKEDYQRALNEQKKEVRELVMAGLGVRKDYYRNYKIYYVIEEDTIYIVRILHMLVDSRAWLYRTFWL